MFWYSFFNVLIFSHVYRHLLHLSTNVFDILIQLLVWYFLSLEWYISDFWTNPYESKYIGLLMCIFFKGIFVVVLVDILCCILWICQVYFESRIREWRIRSAFCVCPPVVRGRLWRCWHVCVCFLSRNDRLWKYIYLGILYTHAVFHCVWKGICSCCQIFHRRAEAECGSAFLLQ